MSSDMKEKCVKLWKYLAETGLESKGIAYQRLHFSLDKHICPACEVADSLRGFSKSTELCVHCPIKSWREFAEEGHRCPCEGVDMISGYKSPYELWQDTARRPRPAGRTNLRKQYAQKMVELIEKEWEDV